MILDDLAPAHMIQVLVLTENTPLLGRSGVRVVVMADQRNALISSLRSYLVCTGPNPPTSGLMFHDQQVRVIGGRLPVQNLDIYRIDSSVTFIPERKVDLPNKF